MAFVRGKTVSKVKTLPSSEAYLPLVHSIASMVLARGLPPNIEYDDLVSDGTIGLMKAWENFDPNRGVKFETYASYRIRGEILDGLKNYNPVPYRVQVMVRDLARKGVRAVLRTKKEQAEDELLEKKELSAEEFKQALKRVKKVVSASALMYLLSVQQMAEAGVEAQVATEVTPASEVDFAELKQKLRALIESLPPLQKKVVELFFNRGINQKTIAKNLGLSRPKVCRVINKAIETLRRKIKQ
jgi:RNA polymerase sigma factor for flagellar operon FliA